ncbi:S-adenosyl-L-methionine-dependent methyltransferase [Peniophora sp. CONT]|nr:S-adenosyl-L-methionine-dependent methyltransferase [Peniophora sp. CONT]
MASAPIENPDSPMPDADSDSDDEQELIALGTSLIQAVLERKSREDIKTIIAAGAPTWYQDDDGWSVLHAAAQVEDAEIIPMLLEEGALWNSVDKLGNSPGDIALSMNNEECYTAIRDAGIRTELTLQLLSAHTDLPPELVLKVEDDSALASTDAYLSSKLRYTTDEYGQEIVLLRDPDNGIEVGVMMGWERELSAEVQESVRALCADHPTLKAGKGLRVLNVGFGLGIIDGLFQELNPPPAEHVIIEPHADVLAQMRERGWYEKPSVRILEGKWQDFVGTDALQAGGFDVVYTDTFSEDYEALHKFFKHVPNLLAGPDARFGFFNGLGATNAVFYDVYTKLAALNLDDLGLETQYEDVDVAEKQGVDRWGRTREYFSMRLYRMPVCRLKST